MPVRPRLRLFPRIAVLPVLAALALAAGLLGIAAPASVARASSAPTSSLAAGATLQPGEFLTSRSGNYRLTMQPDGDLVLANPNCTAGSPNCPYAVWSLGTSGQPGNRLTLQRDGNLVLYSATGRAVWATMTNGTGGANVFQVQDDSNLVLYSAGRAVWSSGTYPTYAHVSGRIVSDLRSLNGRYRFGTPGNSMHVWDLAASDPSRSILWGVNCLKDTRVDCSSLKGQLVLQTDGNLVWYQPGKNGGKVAVWSSGTWGTGRTTNLVLQNDGNLVLYDLWHRPLWNSKGGPVLRVH